MINLPPKAEKYIYHDEPGIVLLHGDCLEVMRAMADNSIDSIVTDPPYGISFMGKKWDYQVPGVDVWVEALRVLKPGGHMLCFAGPRTYHRMVVNIEDAGFEIRDQLQWLYGSGFPKSLDISKALDKKAGAERQATLEAKEWEGWGTGLKPAYEPICVARKPLIGTVAENVLEYGTGGLNIDECRINGIPQSVPNPEFNSPSGQTYNMKTGTGRNGEMSQSDKGRFPSNILLDKDAAALLDEQSGILHAPLSNGSSGISHGVTWPSVGSNKQRKTYNVDGGASRFFYVAKASKADRDHGLELMAIKGKKWGSIQDGRPQCGEGYEYENTNKNFHPTVKPTKLMQYLVRLVTPPGGTVVDNYMGSGSTGRAAIREGFKFIGIERDAEYLPLAKGRIKAPAQIEML